MPVAIDLHFLDHASVIATAVLRGPDGVILIDPGPSTTRSALEQGLAAHGIGMADVRVILLTHIHLDHCGATGSIVADHPEIDVYVHERGAPHLVDPSKLIASATRLYQGDMARLWGEIRPVPASRVRPIGERADLVVAGHPLEAMWTPGHASHHVSYLDPADRTAFTGDTAGMCRPGRTEVVPPVLPPEVDVVAWRQSTDRLLAWQPRSLFLTHFGPRLDPEAHIDRLWARLDDWSDRVRRSLEEPESSGGPEADAALAAAFAKAVAADLARTTTPDDATAHSLAAPFALCWYGLARYHRKRQGGAPAL
jgi:glyoxylase-like metal-dependent hydrolase (beta-lactamase superfamily II)